MDDLCRKSGKSKKTVYKFFRNKSDLVNRVIEQLVEEQKTLLKRSVKNTPNAIVEMANIYSQAINAFKDLNPVLTHDLRKYHPDGWEIFRDYKDNTLMNHIMENLQRGMDEGVYRKDLDREVVSLFYVSRIEDFRNPDIFPPESFSLKRVMRAIFQYHIRGIASTKGLEFLENEMEIDF